MKELACGVQFDCILVTEKEEKDDERRTNLEIFRYRSPYSLVAKSLRHRGVHGELGSIILDTVTATFHTFDRQRGIGYQQRRNNIKAGVQCLRHVECTSIDDLLVSYFPRAQDYISFDNINRGGVTVFFFLSIT